MAKNFFNDHDVKRIGKMLRWYETQTGAGAGMDAAGNRGKNELSITFYNNSGETIPPYSIVELQEGGQIGDNIPYVKAVKPTANGDKYGVNGAVQVESKKYGQAYVSGKCWFAYDTGTPAIGDKYGPDTGLWPATLDGIPGFIECLGIIDSTNKFALGVIGGGGGAIIGVLDDDLTCRTTTGATVIVKFGTPGSESGSDTIVTYDWLVPSGKKIESGTNVVCLKINGYYYAIAAGACPVDV